MSGNGMSSVGQISAKAKGPAQQHGKERAGHYLQAPLPKPRVAAGGGEVMPEWKLNCLCAESGLPPNVREHLPMGGCF